MRETSGVAAWTSVSLRCARYARTAVTFVAMFLIRCYQAMVRPFLVGACKFHPSCSVYALDAICLHGPWRGMLLAVRRLARCHPFSPGGIDLVPEPESRESAGRDGVHLR